MSQRTDQIMALADTWCRKFWAWVMAFPQPILEIFTLALFFLVGLGLKSLL